MKILVIGCGSIGRRHIGNLLKLRAGEIFAFDVKAERRAQAGKMSGRIRVVPSIEKALENRIDIAFVTNPTHVHVDYALKMAQQGCHLFIEKPLSHSLKNIGKLVKAVKGKKLISMVGCNTRFLWSIRKVKKMLEDKEIGRVVSARLEFGKYLPDWHPWEDYRNMYSAHKNMGGGVILDVIHEMDYAMWFFGEVEKCKSLFTNSHVLDIDTEDTAEILLSFRKGPIVDIHLDYIQRSPVRTCRIIGSEGTILADLNEDLIDIYKAETGKWKKMKNPAKHGMNQMYLDEIDYFLNCVRRNQKTMNDIEDAYKTLGYAFEAKKR